MREIVVFSGTAHPEFAQSLCENLGVPLSESSTMRFANDCLEVQLHANCRERDVYLVQPLVDPVQENLVELLLMIDAARGASAGRITAVIPHYAYARSDKKDRPRVSVGGRLIADLLVAAGVNRILAMTLHSPQVPHFFAVPVDHLHALAELADHFRQYDLSNVTVVAPDLGYAKEAAAFARLLGTPVAAGAKQRFPDDKVVIASIIGDVRDRDVIIVDDEIAKGSTVLELLDRLADAGARSARVACTHGLFAADSVDRIAAREDVVEIVYTDTVPAPQTTNGKLCRLTVAPAMAEAVRRIHNGESVSALFDQPLAEFSTLAEVSHADPNTST